MSFVRNTIRQHKAFLGFLGGLVLYVVLSYSIGLSCPIKWFTGISCPGCGMTRSLLSIFRLDFQAALYYHCLIYMLLIGLPVYIFLYVKKKRLACKVLLAIGIGAMIGYYLYRAISGVAPDVVVFSPENGAFPRLFRWLFS